MIRKLATAAAIVLIAVPAAAQFATQYDLTQPRGGRAPADEMGPNGQETIPGSPDDILRRQNEQLRFRSPEDYTTPRKYEGRASFAGTRLGRCAPYGMVRATVLGNQFSASLTFPIERDSVHGSISGGHATGTGSFGYSIQANITEGVINGTALKKSTVKPSPEKPLGTPIPFVTGRTRPEAPPPPKVEDCIYSITLSRVS